MQTITTIGLDIAKSVFQVHGVDTKGNVVLGGSAVGSRRELPCQRAAYPRSTYCFGPVPD